MNDQQPAATAAPSTVPYPSSRQAWTMVFTLLVFYIFSFIDRQILSLLIGPMKRDLELDDFQISLLGGFAFALFYTVLGIPIGRLADRFSRKKIIAVGVIFWSLMATLCGLARTFWTFFAARVGVGVGEAALSPPAYSLITDAFPREKVGTAFSVYNMGIAIGSGIALLVGGLVVGAVSTGATYSLPLLGEVRAWQFVFIVTGAPGILLPLLLLLFREPKRRGLMKVESAAGAEVAKSIPLRDVIAFMIKGGHFYSLHFIAMAMFAMLGYAVGFWLPEVMARTYGISVAEVGKVLGLSTIFINTLGIFTAGRLCDYWTRSGRADAPIFVCFWVAIAVVATSALPAFMPTATAGLIMMCIAGFPFHGYVAMGPMAVNQVTPNQMRAQVSSVYLFVNALLGIGVGPSLVGFISEYVLGDPSQIRYALMIVVVGAGSVAAILSWLARAKYKERLALAAQWH
ncbi:MAG TPA: MFS transporter [Steroidobacteraceae bacterium]|nr:MFS transporter [Steroidobacteraceae bacterium]